MAGCHLHYLSGYISVFYPRIDPAAAMFPRGPRGHAYVCFCCKTQPSFILSVFIPSHHLAPLGLPLKMAAVYPMDTPSRLLRRVQQLEDMELPSLPSFQHEDLDYDSASASGMDSFTQDSSVSNRSSRGLVSRVESRKLGTDHRLVRRWQLLTHCASKVHQRLHSDLRPKTGPRLLLDRRSRQ